MVTRHCLPGSTSMTVWVAPLARVGTVASGLMRWPVESVISAIERPVVLAMTASQSCVFGLGTLGDRDRVEQAARDALERQALGLQAVRRVDLQGRAALEVDAELAQELEVGGDVGDAPELEARAAGLSSTKVAATEPRLPIGSISLIVPVTCRLKRLRPSRSPISRNAVPRISMIGWVVSVPSLTWTPPAISMKKTWPGAAGDRSSGRKPVRKLP